MMLGSETPSTPLVSWDTWGLIVIGVLILVLWLAFRRLFRDEELPAERSGSNDPKNPKSPPGNPQL